MRGLRFALCCAVARSLFFTPLPTVATAQEARSLHLEAGTELVAVYIGANWCLPCRTPLLKEAVRGINARLAEHAAAEDKQFFSIGVAVDLDVEQGIELLRGTDSFNEIVVGRNWANSAVIEHIWSFYELRPALPQFIVFEREVDVRPRARKFGEKRVIQRLVGAEEILDEAEPGRTDTEAVRRIGGMTVLAVGTSQHSAPSLIGRVVDAQTGSPVNAAQVFLEKSDVGSLSDKTGWFQLLGARPGTWTFAVRLIGYEAERLELELETGTVTQVLVGLRPDPSPLSEPFQLIPPAEPRPPPADTVRAAVTSRAVGTFSIR